MKRVSENWYMGTADAVYQNIYSIGSEQPKYVIILSGDHIYKMNYGRMLQQHQDAAADVTVATLTTDPAECRRFAVGKVKARAIIVIVDFFLSAALPAIAVLNLGGRELHGFRIAMRREPVDDRTTGITQANQFCDFVESFARCIVASRSEEHT